MRGEAGGQVVGHKVTCFRVPHLGGPGSAAAVVADGDPERADAIGGRAAEVGRDRVRS